MQCKTVSNLTNKSTRFFNFHEENRRTLITHYLNASLMCPVTVTSLVEVVHEMSLIWGGSRDNQRVASGKKG